MSSSLYSRSARRPLQEIPLDRQEVSSDEEELEHTNKKQRGAKAKATRRPPAADSRKASNSGREKDLASSGPSLPKKVLDPEDDSSSDVELKALKATAIVSVVSSEDSTFKKLKEMINDSKSKLDSVLQAQATAAEIDDSNDVQIVDSTPQASGHTQIKAVDDSKQTVAKCIIIVKTSETAKPLRLKISLTDPMTKVFSGYCAASGTALDAVKFVFEGQRLLETATPASLDMEEDEEYQIEVVRKEPLAQQEKIGFCTPNLIS